MTSDEHVRAASDQLILRERVKLRARFALPVAIALERYFAETVARGLPSDGARNALADLLAPHGLADPDGLGRLPRIRELPDVGKPDGVAEEWRRADLRARGVALDVFRGEVARRNRESPRPVPPSEVARLMLREASSDTSSGTLRRRWRLARVVRRTQP